MHRVPIIAEIGINHNGNLEIAKDLIDVASAAGCNYVKFQKRNPDVCVPESQKNKMKKVPWSEKEQTYLDYKKYIEFNKYEYDELFNYCSSLRSRIGIFASVWDKDSALFMRNYTDIVKIPSALITDLELLEYTHDLFKDGTRLLSTGMSTEKQIEEAVEIFDPKVIFHTNSTYPTPVDELNLKYISHLKEKFPYRVIGYSNHAYGIVPMFASVSLGAEIVEFHITLDHTMWGSDQSSSIEPNGIFKIVKGTRDLEKSLRGNKEREITEGEYKKLESLRK